MNVATSTKGLRGLKLPIRRLHHPFDPVATSTKGLRGLKPAVRSPGSGPTSCRNLYQGVAWIETRHARPPHLPPRVATSTKGLRGLKREHRPHSQPGRHVATSTKGLRGLKRPAVAADPIRTGRNLYQGVAWIETQPSFSDFF